jgi:hypothetical protein
VQPKVVRVVLVYSTTYCATRIVDVPHVVLILLVFENCIFNII